MKKIDYLQILKNKISFPRNDFVCEFKKNLY